MVSRARDGQLTQLAKSALLTYPDAARQLPPPDEPFRLKDQPDALQRVFSKFIEHGVVWVEESRFDRGTGTQAGTWRTNREAYEFVANGGVQRELGTWPRCPHGGLRNLGGGRYTCSEETCGEIYTRTEAELYTDFPTAPRAGDEPAGLESDDYLPVRGLSATERDVLVVLEATGPLLVADLDALLDVSRSTLHRTLDRLAGYGFVEDADGAGHATTAAGDLVVSYWATRVVGVAFGYETHPDAATAPGRVVADGYETPAANSLLQTYTVGGLTASERDVLLGVYDSPLEAASTSLEQRTGRAQRSVLHSLRDYGLLEATRVDVDGPGRNPLRWEPTAAGHATVAAWALWMLEHELAQEATADELDDLWEQSLRAIWAEASELVDRHKRLAGAVDPVLGEGESATRS